MPLYPARSALLIKFVSMFLSLYITIWNHLGPFGEAVAISSRDLVDQELNTIPVCIDAAAVVKNVICTSGYSYALGSIMLNKMMIRGVLKQKLWKISHAVSF